MKDIKDLNLNELEAVIEDWGVSRFRGRQIFSWIYQRGVVDFDAMTDLPLDLRRKLKKNFCIQSAILIKRLKSQDGTEKFLLELKDKNLIESVVIPAKGRITGCLSSQAGCRFGCRFCASGASGFKRDLSASEILEEVLYIKNYSQCKKLTHIVFMGTGEPLDNYANVIKAIRIINSCDGFNIGARRITISTCGIIPGIRKLSDEGLQIELSVSLHAADDKIRSYIMPINRKYPLKDLLPACKAYIKKTNRQVTFEYVLIKGINSDLQSAKKLVTILKGINCKVNLIPANFIKEFNIAPAAMHEIFLFKNILIKSGINVTLRKSRGVDIDAACGQLRLRYENK